MDKQNVLLIISGGMPACDSPALIRGLMGKGFGVQTVLTKAGAEFVTPLTLSALTGKMVCTDTFDLVQSAHINHISLSCSADLVLVAPATANLMAKMATGLADDLASATLLAACKPVLLAPNMNAQMWQNPATQRNVATLKGDGIHFVGPRTTAKGTGAMATCEEILAAVGEII